MLRIVVAIYLMIVAAANPATCCCTLTRLTTPLVPVTTPAIPKAPSCCHCTESQQAPDQSVPSERPAPRCPCKQGGGCEVVALPAPLHEALDSSRAAAEVSDIVLSILMIQNCPLAHAAPVFREASARGVSTGDLLYTFHRLRC